MKTGRTVQELAAEITRQSKNKRDFVAQTRAAEPVLIENVPGIKLYTSDQAENFGIMPVAHGQIASQAGIPWQYYQRMVAEKPELWQNSVTTWLGGSDEKRLIRTLDGQTRAWLSDRYRPLDNAELAEAALPALIDVGAQIVSSEITDKRLYIKAVDPKIKGYIRTDGTHKFQDLGGDEIIWGVCITNSEVGAGRLAVSTFCVRSVCTNGMIIESEFRKHHLGTRFGGGEDGRADEYWRDDTRVASDKALFLQLRDAVAGALTEEKMKFTLDKFSSAAERKITGDVPKAVEVVSKQLGLGKTEQSSILSHLISGGDLSAWGLANAVTRAAADIPGYDRASELEGAGMDVIELSPSQWKMVAEASV